MSLLQFTGIGIQNLLTTLDKESANSDKSNYHYLISFINLFRDEMALLFFYSNGTRYEKFSDQLVDRAIESSKTTLTLSMQFNF